MQSQSAYQDPFVALAFDRAWRADDAIDNGSVTTSLPNYIGPALSLPAVGTGQAIKAASASLGGRRSIAFTAGAAGGYGNVVALGGAPTDFSMISVYRYVSSVNRGVAALTVAGAVNSGLSQIVTTTTRETSKAFKVGNAALCAATLVAPQTMVQVSVWTAAGASDYSKTRTAGVLVAAGALAGTTFHIGALDNSSSFVLDGEWATTGYVARALSVAEINFALTMFGRYYSVTIAP